jgi:hypothetical protein
VKSCLCSISNRPFSLPKRKSYFRIKSAVLAVGTKSKSADLRLPGLFGWV